MLTGFVWYSVVVNFLRGVPVLAEFPQREASFAGLRSAPGQRGVGRESPPRLSSGVGNHERIRCAQINDSLPKKVRP